MRAEKGDQIDAESVPLQIQPHRHNFVRRYRALCATGLVALLAILSGDLVAALAPKISIATLKAQLDDAKIVAANLYPPSPEQAPALRAWLQTNARIADELPQLEQQLTALRMRAKPLSEAQRLQRLQQHPRVPELRRLRHDLARSDSDAVREVILEQIEVLEHELAGHEFTNREDAAEHRALTRLVRELQAFAKEGVVGTRGLLADVRARLHEAETVRQRTIEAQQAAWDQAIDGVRTSTDYQGLALAPQMGLVPIGMDRESQLWEFVHLASGTPGKEIPARDPQTGRLVPSGDMGIVFVLLPGGLLQVEDGEEVDHRHSVQLEPFFLSKYEMTQGQWLRLTGRNPSWTANEKNPDRENDLTLPVESVSWFDSEELMRRQGLRLPTELQWEYGCRAGTTTKWWTGDEADSLRGRENVPTSESDKNRLLPVASFAANAFGLFDVSCNLGEWCMDQFSGFGSERAGDGYRPPHDQERSLFRGGWFGGSFSLDRARENAQSSNRTPMHPNVRVHMVGLRPARVLHH